MGLQFIVHMESQKLAIECVLIKMTGQAFAIWL
jgi:hypothetical protein